MNISNRFDINFYVNKYCSNSNIEYKKQFIHLVKKQAEKINQLLTENVQKILQNKSAAELFFDKSNKLKYRAHYKAEKEMLSTCGYSSSTFATLEVIRYL